MEQSASLQRAFAVASLAISVLTIILNIAIVALIAFLAVSAQWLAAIFFLLARKEIVKALDAVTDRFLELAEKEKRKA